MSAKKLCYCAMSVALAVALSLVSGMISALHFPNGGYVTLFSMLFIMLPAWIYGVKEGVICGLLFGLLQCLIEPCIISVPQFLMDYVLAFSVMGIAGIWKDKRNGLLIGYLAAVLARWIAASLAGLVWVSLGYMAWEGWSPLPYTMAYNAAYIFTEAAATLIVLRLTPVKKNLERLKNACLQA